MKSNVCKIEKGRRGLDAILKESDKVAVYNELSHKQALHLRLLCEELDGMLPELVGDFAGSLFIEYEEGVCRINVTVALGELSTERKENLISIAKNKKNAAATGVVGRIRAALENTFMNTDFAEAFALSDFSYDVATDSHYSSVNYSHYWSLNQYKNYVKSGNKSEAWDELEKSVIASVADDVIVGIKGKQAEILIIKKFA